RGGGREGRGGGAVAAGVVDPGASIRAALSDGEAGDGHVSAAAAETKDPRGVSTADDDLAGPRAVDGQVLGHAQLACQGDRPGEAARESDGVRVGAGVSGSDRGPQ